MTAQTSLAHAPSITTFRNDDGGYTSWLTEHETGFVVNTPTSPSRNNIKLHTAVCAYVTTLFGRGTTFTNGQYIKVCAESDHTLEEWSQETVGGPPQRGCRCLASPGAPKTGASRPRKVFDESVSGPLGASAELRLSLQTGVVIASRRPGYEARNEYDRETKRLVKTVLDDLAAAPGEILHGSIEGGLALGADLDNALLYDMPRRAAAYRHGVLLDRNPRAEIEGVRYRYRLKPEGCGLQPGGRVLATFDDVSLSYGIKGWPAFWQALTESPNLQVSGDGHDGELLVDLTLHGRVPSCSPELVKWLIDGVTVTLQAHDNQRLAALVSPRLAARCGLDEREVLRRLTNRDRAVLGATPDLVEVFRDGVQCHPEDERIAGLRIRLDRSRRDYSLSGTVTTTAV